MTRYCWHMDAHSTSPPRARGWCQEVLGSPQITEEQALEKLHAVWPLVAPRPDAQSWLNEMLEWSFSSTAALLALLDLGARAKEYHLGQLLSSEALGLCSSGAAAMLVERFIAAGASPSRCSHLGAEFPMEPMLALAFRRLPVKSAVAVGEVLLAAGAPIDGPGPEWSHPSGLKRPVEVAAEMGQAELFRWCLEKGARLDVVPDPTFSGCAPSVAHVLRERDAQCRQEALGHALPEAKLASRGPRF